jgi:hypothetical protein
MDKIETCTCGHGRDEHHGNEFEPRPACWHCGESGGVCKCLRFSTVKLLSAAGVAPIKVKR